MTAPDLADRLSELRNGVDALLCIELAMETHTAYGGIFEKGLYYIADHLSESLDALLDAVENEKSGAPDMARPVGEM